MTLNCNEDMTMNMGTYWDLYPNNFTNNELKRKHIPIIRRCGKRKLENYKKYYKENKKGFALPFQ